MKYRPKLIRFIFIAASLCITFSAYGVEGYTKFDTKGLSKAKGLWLTVKYPSNWLAKDGERPNIVQKFVHNDGPITELLMVQIKDVPKEAAKELPLLTENDWVEVLSDIGAGAKVSGVKKIRHEGQPGFIGNVKLVEERAGLSLYQNQRVLSIFYKNSIIFLWCGTSSTTAYSALVNTVQERNSQGVCHQFFNSLVLMDRY